MRARAKTGTLVLALTLCACAYGCPIGVAWAAPTAKLSVGVRPNRPGASTTISFGFQIAAPVGGELPPALTQLDVRLPPGMAIETAGLASCSEAKLEHGPQACPKNARVGGGSVNVQVPLGSVTRLEKAALSVFNGPPRGGRTLLFYAAGRLPIATQLVFTGAIVPGPLGPQIQATIPLIPTLPNTPDAAIVAMTANLGTLGRTYYRSTGGRQVRFTPKGAVLPKRCPAGGWPFAAEFRFQDGSLATARSSVACPG